MDENSSQDDIRELSDKLDAVLGLLFVMGKRSYGWTITWAIQYLLEFGLSDKCVTAITGATEDVMRNAKFKRKTGKFRRIPSLWDRFYES